MTDVLELTGGWSSGIGSHAPTTPVRSTLFDGTPVVSEGSGYMQREKQSL